jgi:hypothetical protein
MRAMGDQRVTLQEPHTSELGGIIYKFGAPGWEGEKVERFEHLKDLLNTRKD